MFTVISTLIASGAVLCNSTSKIALITLRVVIYDTICMKLVNKLDACLCIKDLSTMLTHYMAPGKAAVANKDGGNDGNRTCLSLTGRPFCIGVRRAEHIIAYFYQNVSSVNPHKHKRTNTNKHTQTNKCQNIQTRTNTQTQTCPAYHRLLLSLCLFC